MEAHKVGLSLVMASNHGGVLLSFMQHLSHIHVKAQDLHDNFGRLASAITGAFAVVAGTKLLETMTHMVEKGNQLVRVRQNMGQAGMTALEVQNAHNKALELSRQNMNMSVVEVMKVQNDARSTFGDVEHAAPAIKPIVSAGSFMRAHQGDEKGKATHEAFTRELGAALKSGEIAGKVSAKEMEEHIGSLVAMKVLYGGSVKMGDYLIAQRRAGVALRNTSDEFRYGIFPALIQEQKQGAGVQMMTAFQKIVAGNTNREHAYQSMLKYGIADPGAQVVESTSLRGKKTKMVRGSGIREPELFARNPLEWVEKILKPALDTITGGNNPIMEAQLIGQMFPDRNAQMFLTELLQQATKLHKDATLLQGVRRDFTNYKDNSWIYQVQAFKTQWDNLITALGAPGVADVTDTLRGVNEFMAKIAAYAGDKANADIIGKIAGGIGVLGVALTGAGVVAVMAAIGPAGWIAGGIIALAGAATALDWEKEWALFKQNLSDLHTTVEEWTNKWNGMKESAIAWASGQLSDFATWVTETQARWDETKTKMVEYIGNIPTKIIETVKTWPERIKASIVKLGEDLLGRLTNFIQRFREGAGRVTPGGDAWQINYNQGGGGGTGYGPPGTFDARIAGNSSLPAGMRNNNPGNLKFSSASASKYPGVLGPSVNTDQGDHQIRFDTPEHGMQALALLAKRKYEGGRHTVNDLVAAQGGWTPGNYQAAANIARSMGVSPTAQLNLNDPGQLAKFTRGIVLQEHGPASSGYSDAMIRQAIGGGPARTPPSRRKSPPIEIDTTIKLDNQRISEPKQQYDAKRHTPAASMAA